MRANVLPWLLVALMVGAWLGATFLGGEVESGAVDGIGAEDEGAVHAELAALRLEVRRRASAQSRLWLDQVRTLESHLVREEALRAIRAGIDSEDPVQRLAALRAVRWAGSNDYDHAEYRAAIEPHANGEDPDVRRAAREALAVVQPRTSDLALWIEEAQRADRSYAETTTEVLVRVAEGRVEGEVAPPPAPSGSEQARRRQAWARMLPERCSRSIRSGVPAAVSRWSAGRLNPLSLELTRFLGPDVDS